jgi:hypothetical protein
MKIPTRERGGSCIPLGKVAFFQATDSRTLVTADEYV